jgi:sugar lactone lactonase YvrE
MSNDLHGRRIAARTDDRLGETPLWHADEGRLYWIDFYGPSVHRLDPASGEVRSWSVPGAAKIGSLAFASGGRLLLATDRGVLAV